MKFDMLSAYDAVSEAVGGAWCELRVAPPPVGRTDCYRLVVVFRSPVTRNTTDLNILFPREELSASEASELNDKWMAVLAELRRQYKGNAHPEGGAA